jgi:anthranilate synthase/indole-3-glycerol phosphate synthase/phosphoribosylanthranilate isomerase
MRIVRSVWHSLALLSSVVASVDSFLTHANPRFSSPFFFKATKAPQDTTTEMSTTPQSSSSTPPAYTDTELHNALGSLLAGSTDASFDARHLFGYNDPNHKLSMLQTITATRILDYQEIVRQAAPESTSTATTNTATSTSSNSSPTPSQADLIQAAAAFAADHGPVLDLQAVIQNQSPRMALAAEFKRASPSKGDIALGVAAGEQAVKYFQAGANIVSVLTEAHWFRGSLADMTDARLETTRVALENNNDQERPAILRKDFVVNTYQIAEAAAGGADTVLLIVAVLPQYLLKQLIDFSRSIGMEPLVEVHAHEELDVAIQAGAKVLGVNNRNLHTFQMDLATTENIAKQLTGRGLTFDHEDPNATITVAALSGMSTAFDVDRYRQAGVGMCLIGESLMRATDPAAAIASLCLHPDDFADANAMQAGGAYTAGTKIIKVCGITNAQDALVACRSGANMIGVIFAEKSKRFVTAQQATEVVQAVRDFGERSQRTTFRLPDPAANLSPLAHLVACSRSLVEATQRPIVVGVFQNHSPEFIREMVEECGLDMVQLHGSEGMQAANAKNCGVPAIRVVDIATDPETGKASSDAAEALLKSVTNDPVAVLLDTSIKGAKDGGGTGTTFDWSIAQKVQDAGLPILIAGGLTVDNVPDAVGSIRPFGVDVSSGVEQVPGKKNHQKVKDFVGGARNAATEASKGF